MKLALFSLSGSSLKRIMNFAFISVDYHRNTLRIAEIKVSTITRPNRVCFLQARFGDALKRHEVRETDVVETT